MIPGQHDDLVVGDGPGEIMIEEQAIHNPASKILNPRLIDLDGCWGYVEGAVDPGQHLGATDRFAFAF